MPQARTEVCNGKRLFAIRDVDSRSSVARRFRSLVDDIAADLGGYDRSSELEKQLIRRAASLAIMAEAIETDLVNEKEIDVDRYGNICDRLGRIASRLGLSRLTRDVCDPRDRTLSSMFRGRGETIDGDL